VIFRKLLLLVLVPFSILKALWRRAVCRSGRGRKNSGHLLPLSIHKPLVNDSAFLSNNEPELQPWEGWDGLADSQSQAATDKREAASYSSRDGRQVSGGKQKVAQLDKQPEDDMDFFQDMTPRVTRNTKIVLHKNDDVNSALSRAKFAISNDVPIPDKELGAWDDRMTESAWAEEACEDLSWQATNEVREKKKIEREQRHQDQLRKKEERKPVRAANLTAVRLS